MTDSTQDTDVDLIDVEFVNIRVGDTVTLAFNGHEFTGTAWKFNGSLRVGSETLYGYDGRYSECVFISATRLGTETCWNGDEIVDGKAYLVRYGAACDCVMVRTESKWRWPLGSVIVTNVTVSDPSAVKPLCALPLTPEQLNEALA